MLINPNHKNKQIATGYGRIAFDSEGVSRDLTEEQEKHLSKLEGYSYESEQETKATTEETQSEPQPEVETTKEAVIEETTEPEEVEPQQEEDDWSQLPEEELKAKSNKDMKQYLDDKGIDYPTNANKEKLMNAIYGK